MEKIPVGILGATGTVGQKFAALLADHPWFEITALGASDRSIGKPYKDAIRSFSSFELPKKIADMPISSCTPDMPCKIVFSGLDSSVAGVIEEDFAKAGYHIISNSKNHRMHPQVPLLIPEVNPDHLQMIASQPFGRGSIVTNPNCSVIGISMALKPLLDKWGVEASHIVTMQAISGAGYPGVASLDILDNIIPHIDGEEEKIQIEPLKIFGHFEKNQIASYPILLSAQVNRVSVTDGHMACIAVKLKEKATKEEIITAWESFSALPQELDLPSAPKKPLTYHENERHPQPKHHRGIGNGMTVSIGKLQKCPLLDWKFVVLAHNTVRGAAGCAILNAELMLKMGHFK